VLNIPEDAPNSIQNIACAVTVLLIIKADTSLRSVYPVRNPKLLFTKIAPEQAMFSNTDLASSGLPDQALNRYATDH